MDIDTAKEAHKHSTMNDEIMESETVGCFYCMEIFSPDEIDDWIPEIEVQKKTPVCPKCKVDALIGSKSGYSITKEFLGLMYEYWFS